MSYEFYKILHIMSLFLLFISLGILVIYPKYLKPLLLSLHGLSVLILFVSGFGLIAKMKLPLKLSATFQEHSFKVISTLILLAILNFVYILMKRLFGFHISSWISKISASVLVLYFLALLPLSIAPSWIGKKIMVWTLLGISPIFLRMFQSTNGKRVFALITVILMISYYAVYSAVYKV